VLIYGGSTATGIFGIQFAKLSGKRVIATASPKNFDYLKSLGAEAVFDYNKPMASEDIRTYTNNTLKRAWDCTGLGAKFVARCLSSTEDSKYASIMPVSRDELISENPRVDGPYETLMYSIFGERFIKGGKETPPQPDEFEYAKQFLEMSYRLLESGKLQVPRVTLNKGGVGLQGVLRGLDDLRTNAVSGGKLVYTL
jgi:NADPH:quinone reductase-like Zn-dependent oxidoreductase